MRIIDVLILLTLGITMHDVASILGFHIEGLHAIYFSIPMAAILLAVKLIHGRPLGLKP